MVFTKKKIPWSSESRGYRLLGFMSDNLTEAGVGAGEVGGFPLFASSPFLKVWTLEEVQTGGQRICKKHCFRFVGLRKGMYPLQAKARAKVMRHWSNM
jgi:hypothetical protein